MLYGLYEVGQVVVEERCNGHAGEDCREAANVDEAVERDVLTWLRRERIVAVQQRHGEP